MSHRKEPLARTDICEAFSAKFRKELEPTLRGLGLMHVAAPVDDAMAARFGAYASQALQKRLQHHTTIRAIDLIGILHDQSEHKGRATLAYPSYNAARGESAIQSAIPPKHPDHAFFAEHKASLEHAIADLVAAFASDVANGRISAAAGHGVQR